MVPLDQEPGEPEAMRMSPNPGLGQRAVAIKSCGDSPVRRPCSFSEAAPDTTLRQPAPDLGSSLRTAGKGLRPGLNVSENRATADRPVVDELVAYDAVKLLCYEPLNPACREHMGLECTKLVRQQGAKSHLREAEHRIPARAELLDQLRRWTRDIEAD